MKSDEPFIITIITDLANITKMMTAHFKEEKKAVQWLNNALPEGETPTEMIFKGQTEKLVEYIKRELINEL